MIRELPTGKGFADIFLIPRKIHMDKPAVIIELKWDKECIGCDCTDKGEKVYEMLYQNYQRKSCFWQELIMIKRQRQHTCLIEKVDYKK